jgi:hypothetical protein
MRQCIAHQQFVAAPQQYMQVLSILPFSSRWSIKLVAVSN